MRHLSRQIELGGLRMRDLARHGDYWHLCVRPDIEGRGYQGYRVLHLSSRQITVQDLLRKELQRQLNLDLSSVSASEFYAAMKFLFEQAKEGEQSNVTDE